MEFWKSSCVSRSKVTIARQRNQSNSCRAAVRQDDQIKYFARTHTSTYLYTNRYVHIKNTPRHPDTHIETHAAGEGCRSINNAASQSSKVLGEDPAQCLGGCVSGVTWPALSCRSSAAWCGSWWRARWWCRPTLRAGSCLCPSSASS